MHNGLQRTRVALSQNGLQFSAHEEILATAYLRIFKLGDWIYAFTMPAQLYRSRASLDNFEQGLCLTGEPIRHHALLNHGGHWYLL
jgi:hypothetical protein